MAFPDCPQQAAARSLRRVKLAATRKLLAEFRSESGEPMSAAIDWHDLKHRMRFISALLRIHHDDASLFECPA